MTAYQYDYAICFTTTTGIFTESGICFNDAIDRANSAVRAWENAGYRYNRSNQSYVNGSDVRSIVIISPDGSIYNA